MNTDKVYKPTIKNFMGIADVRVIQDGRNEYVVLKDVFDCLGLVSTDNKGNSTWAMPKKKMMEFLEIINKECDVKTFYVRFKDKQSPKGQVREVECLNIETVPVVLTQFKPTARRGEDALDKWSKFMQFVNDLFQYHELHKYIITDKDKQKETMDEIVKLGGKPVIVNQMVNKIMGELILQEEPKFAIKKDELKVYQPRISIDLLEVRDFVMKKFTNAYEVLNDHQKAYEHALKMARKEYSL
jgi:hypothetical protein